MSLPRLRIFVRRIRSFVAARVSASSLGETLTRSTASLVVLALAILTTSPTAHAWIHEDEGHEHADHGPATDHPDHVCGVTLAQQGFCDTTPVVTAPAAPTLLVEQCGNFPRTIRWTTPEYWLQPAQGPPAPSATQLAR